MCNYRYKAVDTQIPENIDLPLVEKFTEIAYFIYKTLTWRVVDELANLVKDKHGLLH